MKKFFKNLTIWLLTGIIVAGMTVVSVNASDNNVRFALFYDGGHYAPMTLANGAVWGQKQAAAGVCNFVSLCEFNNHITFCIEPGVSDDGKEHPGESCHNPITSHSLSAAQLKYANAHNLSTGDQERLMRFILAYGYTGDANPSTWRNNNNDQWLLTRYKTDFAKAMATQLLLQEVAVGERDADFNLITYYDGSKPVKNYVELNDYKSDVYEEYDEIQNKVNEALGNAKSTTEDTAYESETINISLGTINLELKSNGKVEGETEFPQLSDLKEGSTLTSGPSISIDLPGVTIDGNTIKVSMTLAQAINYMEMTIPGTVTKTTARDWNTTREGKAYYYADEIDVYHQDGNGQDTICINGDPVEHHGEIITPHHKTYNYTYSFSVKVPTLHKHKFLPHVTEATCTSPGITDYWCTCGVKYTYRGANNDGLGNTIPQGSVTDPLGHDYSDNSPWVTTIPATCTGPGEMTQLCSRCGVVVNSKEIPALGHGTEDDGDAVWMITAQPTKYAAGEKSLVCSKCGVTLETKPVARHEHTFGYESVVVSPTCFRKGLTGSFCAECGACYETRVTATSHADEIVWVTGIPATCTDGGAEVGYCADCGVQTVVRATEAKGHGESVWMTSVPAECLVKGEKVKVCLACGEVTDTEETEALGHDDGVWTVSREATCEAEGEEVCICTRCGETIGSRRTPALGHVAPGDGVWKIDMEPTPDHDGTKSCYCTRCGMALATQRLTMHEHVAGAIVTLFPATCTSDGEKGTLCRICGAVFETETVPALGHNLGEVFTLANKTHAKVCDRCRRTFIQNCTFDDAVTPADCSTPGCTEHTCADCGYSYIDKYRAPLGHSFSAWESDGKTTHTRYCERCGVYETRTHAWSEYRTVRASTTTQTAVLKHNCVLCGESEEVRGEKRLFSQIVFDYIRGYDGIFGFMIRFVDLFKTIRYRILSVFGGNGASGWIS